MKKYLVVFYFGTIQANPYVKTEKVVVEVPEGASKNDIIIEGLKMYNKPYPRTYYADVLPM